MMHIIQNGSGILLKVHCVMCIVVCISVKRILKKVNVDDSEQILFWTCLVKYIEHKFS